MGMSTAQKVALTRAMGGYVKMDAAAILEKLYEIHGDLCLVVNGGDPDEATRASAHLGAVSKMIDMIRADMECHKAAR